MKVKFVYILLIVLVAVAGFDTYLNFLFEQKPAVASKNPTVPCTTAQVTTRITYHTASSDGLTSYNIIASNKGPLPCTVHGGPTLTYTTFDNKVISEPIRSLLSSNSTLTLNSTQSVVAELSTYIDPSTKGVNQTIGCVSGIGRLRFSMPGDTRYRLIDSPFGTSCMLTTLTVFRS